MNELHPLLYSLLALFVGGSLAFGLGFSEFLLVSRTSSLTLSIAGIFKVNDLFKLALTLFYFRISKSALLVKKKKNLSLFLSVGGVHFAACSRIHGRQNEHSELVGVCCVSVWYLTTCGDQNLLQQRFGFFHLLSIALQFSFCQLN